MSSYLLNSYWFQTTTTTTTTSTTTTTTTVAPSGGRIFYESPYTASRSTNNVTTSLNISTISNVNSG